MSQAAAGADVVAPSDMMDGRVAAIRAALDENGFEQTPILSYAVKYASSFYGPFREAAGSAPAFGDRKGYQMDVHNRREALKEALLDVEEGADMLMVKPAMAFGDILREVKDAVQVPIAAYSVSGEYSLIKAAARAGLDKRSGYGLRDGGLRLPGGGGSPGDLLCARTGALHGRRADWLMGVSETLFERQQAVLPGRGKQPGAGLSAP